MLRLLLAQGITAIPIHNSFVAQAHHAEAVEEATRAALDKMYPAISMGVRK